MHFYQDGCTRRLLMIQNQQDWFLQWNYLELHEHLIWQMSNDPEADTDRKIISCVLKPEFILPVQDNMAYILKFMNPKIPDQKEVMYSFWCLMKGTLCILWANWTLDIKIFTDILCTSNSELSNANQLSIPLNICYILYFSKLASSK